MDLSSLTKSTTRSQKRLGRGYASGKGGHTSSRGQKGQKSRSSIKIWFEGGQLPLTRRLPFLKGKDRFKSLTPSPIIVNLGQLNSLKSGSIVTKETLVKTGLLSLKEAAAGSIKILASGKLEKPLTFKGLTLSQSAQSKVEQAGGKVESSPSKSKSAKALNSKESKNTKV